MATGACKAHVCENISVVRNITAGASQRRESRPARLRLVQQDTIVAVRRSNTDGARTRRERRRMAPRRAPGATDTRAYGDGGG